MSRLAVAAAAFAALAVFLLLAKQGQQQTGRVQLLQGSRWQHGPLAGTAPLVTQCAKGNNAACDQLASNPSAMGALQTIDRSNPQGFAAMHPREARILRGVHSAQSEGLMEMPSGRQGLYMGDNWMIGGLDSLSEDTSSGNSLFDFGVYDGTPIDPESGSPHKGTLDDKFIQKAGKDKPWQFDIVKIRRSEDGPGYKPPGYYPKPPFNFANQYGYVFGGPSVGVIDGHITDIDDGINSA